jgi:hypothetical protein
MPPRRQQAQVAVAAILAPASHPPAPRRLVQVAFAGPLALHLPERRRPASPASQYHQALDLLQQGVSAQELCVPNPTAVEVAAEPPQDFPAWLMQQRGLPSGE